MSSCKYSTLFYHCAKDHLRIYENCQIKNMLSNLIPNFKTKLKTLFPIRPFQKHPDTKQIKISSKQKYRKTKSKPVPIRTYVPFHFPISLRKILLHSFPFPAVVDPLILPLSPISRNSPFSSPENLINFFFLLEI